MPTVANILAAKGYVVYRAAPDESVFVAVRRMAAHDVGSLLVVDEAGHALGILTERDCLRRLVLDDRRPKDTRVQTVMCLDTYAVTPDVPIEQCMSIMTERRVRHLSVTEGTTVVGIVSIGDVVKAQTSAHRSSIEEMTQYIQGRA